MDKTIFRYFQCMIVLEGWPIYLAGKWTNGQLYYYINMRFAVFTLIGILGLAIMAVIGLLPLFNKEQDGIDPQSEPRKQKTNLAFIFLLPIVIAILGLSDLYIWVSFIFVFLIGPAACKAVPGWASSSFRYSWNGIDYSFRSIVIGYLCSGTTTLRRILEHTRGMGLSAPASIGQTSVKDHGCCPR